MKYTKITFLIISNKRQERIVSIFHFLFPVILFYYTYVTCKHVKCYLRTECDKTFFAHERPRNECFICTNVPNTSSRIEVCTIFFETNIDLSDLTCTLCEQMALAKMSIELTYAAIAKRHFESSEFKKKINVR
jgi:hypothetical protein